jgi:aspartyl-tRNA(Asn)/glutamyl-tRNA(Gln) amidotransferase subunit A
MTTALSLNAAYAARTTSPVDTINAALAAIATDPTNSWVHIATDSARAAAKASESRWASNAPLSPLDGIPIGVKDLLAVAGQPLRRGSLALPTTNIPTEDAPLVARLRAAGAILIGKTSTPDSGCKLDTTSLVHGTTLNPHNLALTPGGSSGGTAAALALGHVPIAIGTDGGGSIRVPAAYCGVFGLKSSAGRIPGLLGPFWPHSVAGPMSRTVLDTALTWNIVTQPDPRDPYALPPPTIDWVEETKRGIAGLRIAVAESFNGIGATPEITAALHAAAAKLQAAGATITRAEPAWPGDPLAPFMVFWRSMYAQAVTLMPPDQAALIDPAIKHIIAQADSISRQDFQMAIHQRDQLALTMSLFHQNYDLLLCPVMPRQPWPAGRATPEPFAEDDWAWCPFAYPFNMTRQPAASVPMGKDAANMPLAVQIVAAAGRDDLVFRAAYALELPRE